MSLEQAITELTAAINANTAALKGAVVSDIKNLASASAPLIDMLPKAAPPAEVKPTPAEVKPTPAEVKPAAFTLADAAAATVALIKFGTAGRDIAIILLKKHGAVAQKNDKESINTQHLKPEQIGPYVLAARKAAREMGA